MACRLYCTRLTFAECALPRAHTGEPHLCTDCLGSEGCGKDGGRITFHADDRAGPATYHAGTEGGKIVLHSGAEEERAKRHEKKLKEAIWV